MSITASLNLSLLLSDGLGTLTKPVSGLAFIGAEENYRSPKTIGTSPTAISLPVSPAEFVYVRNLAPGGLAAPGKPTLASVSGGTLAGTTYYVKVSLVNASGETTPSTEASLAVSLNNVLVVSPPAAIGSATGWNVYVSTGTGTETKQNTSVLPFGVAWTMPATGLISGSALPSSNTTAIVLSVTWTPQGGTSASVIDLLPQAVIVLCEPTSAGGYNAASGLGGMTALTLAASAAGCPAEIILVG